MIWFNGFPFLDSKEEHTFHVSVSAVMTTSSITLLPSTGLSLRALESTLKNSKFQGFPVVQDVHSKTLIGYIGRTELRYAIDRAKNASLVSPNAKCLFEQPESTAVRTPLATAPPITFEDIASSSGTQTVDFTRFVDPTPLTVHPRLPLETVMELFKKMGPRVILVEYRGTLAGLVTVKDCLKYQFKVEAQENPRDESTLMERQEMLWRVFGAVGGWVREKAEGWSGGRIRLGEAAVGLQSGTDDPRDEREAIGVDGEGGGVGIVDEAGGILEGTEEGVDAGEQEGMELMERR